MNDLQKKIIEAMEIRSGKGKTKIYPNDLAKKLSITVRELNKGVRPLIEEAKLSYWYPGSTTYIMLQKDCERQKLIEEGS